MAIFQNANAISVDSEFELKSGRFNVGVANYLKHTTQEPTSKRRMTLSVWVKQPMHNGGILESNGISDWDWLGFAGSGYNIKLRCYLHGGTHGDLITTRCFRDQSAWYHIVMAMDTDQPTGSDRIQLFVNGTRIVNFATNSKPSEGREVSNWNAMGSEQRVFSNSTSSGMIMSEYYWVDGYQLDPTYFGEEDTVTGQWKPKKPADIKKIITFGNNGYYLPFSNDSIQNVFTDSASAGTWQTDRDPETQFGSVTTTMSSASGNVGQIIDKTQTASSGWLPSSGQTVSAQNVTFDCGSALNAKQMVGAKMIISNTYNDGVWKWQGSNDNVTYSDIGVSGATFTMAGLKSEESVDITGSLYENTTAYRYYRWQGVSGTTTANNFWTEVIPLLKSEANGGGINVTSDLIWDTSNGISTIQVLVNGSLAQDDTGGGWFNAGQAVAGKYLRFDMGPGVTKTYTWAFWVSRQSSGSEGTWKWQGSQDQSSWTDIGSNFTLGSNEGNYNNWHQLTELSGNTTAYRYYQIVGISGTTNGSGRRLAMYFGGLPDGTGMQNSVNGNAVNKRIVQQNWQTNGKAHNIGPKMGASCIRFERSDSDRMNIPDAAYLPIKGTGQWTIECFINFNDALESGHPGYGIFGQYASSTSRWSMYQSRSGLSFYSNNSGTEIGDIDTSIDLIAHTWHHIALQRESDTTFSWYIDGVFLGTHTDGDNIADVSSIFHIGWNGDSGYNSFDGYMDEIRVSNIARYSGSTYTVPTEEFTSDANTMLLIHSNGAMGNTTFTDSSSNAATISVNGSPIHIAPKMGKGMGVYNGTDAYLSSQNIDRPWTFLGYDDFTIDFWMWKANPGGGGIIYEEGASADRAIQIYERTDNKMQLYLSTDGNSWDTNVTTAATVPTEAWVHIAVVRSSGSVKFYVNGTNDANFASVTHTYINNSGRHAYIGCYDNGNSSFHNGYIDEFRLSRGTARWTANFTPETTAYQDDRFTTFLLHMDGGGGVVDGVATQVGEGSYFLDSAYDAIWYSGGLPTTEAHSLHFWQGSGSSLSLSDNPEWKIAAGEDFTWEGWCRFYDSGSSNSFTDFWKQGGNYEFGRYEATKKITAWVDGLTLDQSTGTLLNDMRWRHWAVSRNSGTIRLFLEGALIDSGSANNAVSFNTNPSMGTVAGGTIWASDDLRFSKGISRYNAPFTPPTESFTNDQYTYFLMKSLWTEGGMGADHSGKGNWFEPVNMTVNDSLDDSPMNNFATMNSNRGEGTVTYDKGNCMTTYSSGPSCVPATQHCQVASYWEIRANDAVPTFNIGACDYRASPRGSIGYVGTDAGGWGYGGNTGTIVVESTTGSTFSTVPSGGIIAFAYDPSNGTIKCSIDGIWQNGGASIGTVSASTRDRMMPAYQQNTATPMFANFGQDSSFGGNLTSQGNQDENGKGDFYYPVPAGYLAMCTDNWTAPTFAKPETQFNTTLYTGNGSTQTVTGTGFKSDITWIKQRNSTENQFLATSVRDTDGNKYFYVNTGTVEGDRADGITAWNSDGFSLGSWANNNTNTSLYAAWNWLVNTANVSNTAGSQTVTQRVNSDAGWSVGYYTGTGSAGATFGHGLSQAPEFIWVENLSATHQSICYSSYYSDENYYFSVQDGDAYANSASAWNDTAPTSTLVTLGDGASGNGSGNTELAFCFHSVPQFSAVGWYQGNGNSSSNWPMIYTAFRPAIVLVKRLDAAGDWRLWDDKREGYNPDNDHLTPNQNFAEQTDDRVDFYANGFRLLSSSSVSNHSGGAYFYYAIAQDPFKTANAR